ncbi:MULTISPECIES: hypothetical protein [unclassified Meiothermus]|uniref:hypothetical protein n=1 Tax=unclassified Meiothermus TaxID=370471 RepID=UPI001F225948|nr:MULTISPECIES: hypothetical protein [unclassified Meiothermus]
MSWLSLLPWALLVLGLLPLGSYPARSSLYPGVVFLVAALTLAGAASLYSRAPVGPRVRVLWVLGLGFLAYSLACQSAFALAFLPSGLYALGGWVALGSGVTLLTALYQSLRREPFWVPRLEGSQYRDPSGAMNRNALHALAPSLEAAATRRPLVLLLMQTPPNQDPTPILRSLRGPDLLFQMGEGVFLVILQNGGPEAAGPVFRRLKAAVPLQAYTALPFKGGSLKKALEQLEAELSQIYLTQPDLTEP